MRTAHHDGEALLCSITIYHIPIADSCPMSAYSRYLTQTSRGFSPSLCPDLLVQLVHWTFLSSP